MSLGRIRETTRSRKKIGRKTRLKSTTPPAGTLLLSNRRALFPIAPRNFAKTGRLITRTLPIDATNCTQLKGKDHQERDLILSFSLKAQKAKGKVTERAKANQAKVKESEAKEAKENNLRVGDAHLRTRATSASNQGITKLNVPSLRPSLPRLGMSASEPNCPTKRSTSTTC
jgi:hypothetical protein